MQSWCIRGAQRSLQTDKERLAFSVRVSSLFTGARRGKTGAESSVAPAETVAASHSRMRPGSPGSSLHR